MPLTQDEAASALRAIEQTGRRSGEAFGYRISAPYFILWGLVWAAGYTASDLFPDPAGWIWIGLIVLATIVSAFIGRTIKPKNTGKTGWQTAGLILIVALFIFATYAVMWPVSPKQQAAFVPLLTASAYASVGVFMGFRWVVAGASVAALTMLGFFYVGQHFDLWMAAVGGGGLIVAGLWMRSA